MSVLIRKRLLSILLVLTMVVSMFPTTFAEGEQTEAPLLEEEVFGEESSDLEGYFDTVESVDFEEPVEAEEPVSEDGLDETEEPTDVEEPVDVEEPIDVEEPTDVEEPADVEEPVNTDEFTAGYVLIKAETVVYKTASLNEEFGTFPEDAVVYAVLAERADEFADSWLGIVFDTENAKAANEDLPVGYVQYKSVTVLSYEEAAELKTGLEVDVTVRRFAENPLPLVVFEVKEEEEIVAAAVAEVPVEETEPEEAGEVTAASAALPVITVQPTNQTKAVGERVYFKITATGEGLSYQWYYRSPTATKWSKPTATSSRTRSYTFPVQEKHDGWRYYCVVTNADGSVDSDVVTLTLAEMTAPVITVQPTDVTANDGTEAVLSVTADGEDLNWQWYGKAPDAAEWTAIEGADAATYTIDAVKALDGWQYYCVVTNTAGSAESDPVTLTVLKLPVITVQPTDQTKEVGERVYFRITAEGEGLSYQWYYKSPTATKWSKPTATSSRTKNYNFPVQAKHDGWQYYCVVTNADGSVDSDVVTLTLYVPQNVVLDDVTYEPITDTTCRVLSYSGSASALVIPETVEGMTVVEIGVGAFMNNTTLASIDLPDTIAVIKARAFMGCTSLSNMY